jgi:hypothetical protein
MQRVRPLLTLSDEQGFEAILGSAFTEIPSTGETEHSSAASLTLFGKNKKVIWRAP